jgi:hypothetical protein
VRCQDHQFIIWAAAPRPAMGKNETHPFKKDKRRNKLKLIDSSIETDSTANQMTHLVIDISIATL